MELLTEGFRGFREKMDVLSLKPFHFKPPTSTNLMINFNMKE
jgi:hypothetical protein